MKIKDRIPALLLVTAAVGLVAVSVASYDRFKAVEGLKVLPESGISAEGALLNEADASSALTFPIDINSAGAAELMALPGIGETLSDRIIRYREENGPFGAIEELLNVEGIGEKKFEAVRDLITATPQHSEK